MLELLTMIKASGGREREALKQLFIELSKDTEGGGEFFTRAMPGTDGSTILDVLLMEN